MEKVLIEVIHDDLYQSLSPYEHLLEACSRRIDHKHRFVYEALEEEQMEKISSLWIHYEF